MPKDVKCAECGFLGVRLCSTRAMVDADEAMRVTGSLTHHGNLPAFDQHPICVARVVDFYSEMAPNPDPGQRKHHLQRTRDCEEFVKWHPGLSPKEHLELQQLQEQRVYNTRMIEADRQWREQERSARADEAMRVEARHQQDSHNAERRFRWGIVATIAAVILGQLLAARIGSGNKPIDRERAPVGTEAVKVVDSLPTFE